MARPIEWPEDWKALADAYGGVDELAKALGTTPMTLWRWANGEVGIRGPAVRLLAVLAAARGIKCPVDATKSYTPAAMKAVKHPLRR